MKRCKTFIAAVMLLFLIMPPMTVSADIGPKPSVVITFEGLEEEEYYVTLLSEKTSTGPWSEGNPYYEYMGEEAVFDKFAEYEDGDGYHFLSYMQECSDDDVFDWTYYPPDPFKILIYFPEYDKFLSAETICERYAFDSYFTVEVTGMETLAEVNTEIRKSYDYTMEIVSFFVRVVLTIAIEILIALLFGYRGRKPLLVITVTNVLTQVVLNVLLNVINYQSGHYAFIFHYIWMEMVVFVIEGVIYQKLIGKVNPLTNKRYHPYGYAAVANLGSLVAGIWIAGRIPGFF